MGLSLALNEGMKCKVMRVMKTENQLIKKMENSWCFMCSKSEKNTHSGKFKEKIMYV